MALVGEGENPSSSWKRRRDDDHEEGDDQNRHAIPARLLALDAVAEVGVEALGADGAERPLVAVLARHRVRPCGGAAVRDAREDGGVDRGRQRLAR